MASAMDLDPPAVGPSLVNGQTESEETWDWDQQVSSITSSVFDYEYENGRRYHGYKAGVYPLPNDEKELDRLDLQHHVCTLALSGDLHLAPLSNPRRVLDIGCGTGLWSILMADAYPEAHVLGVDLSPVQPDMVPENVHFEIDDIESPWLYEKNSFDYIHSRIMFGAISDWKKLLRQSLAHLKPGGYLEMQELDPRVLSDDGTDASSPYNVEFTRELIRASTLYGKPVPFAHELKEMMEEAGFVDVEARYYKMPFNTWPRAARLKEIGKYQLINYYEGYEAIGIGLFSRVLGWTESEFQVFIAKIRNELRDREIHTYNTFAVVYGRKPPAGAPTSHPRAPNAPAVSGNVQPVHAGPSTPRRERPPVPLFHQTPSKPQSPQGTPERYAPTSAAAAVAASDRPSYPSKLTFRINRRGELIRLREGENPAETAADKNTVYQFTVRTGQINLSEVSDARSGSSGKKSSRDLSPAAQAAHKAKLVMLKRSQEEEARTSGVRPGSKLPQTGFALAPGMKPNGGGLYFTKESYARILAK